MFHDREAVHGDQPVDTARVVHRETEGDQGTAVVTHDREPVVAEAAHELGDVGGHPPCGGLRVAGLIGRQCRSPVAAQVGADDGVRAGEDGRDTEPGGVCPRVPVQEHDRRPVAAVAHAQPHVPDVDIVRGEVVEHAIS